MRANCLKILAPHSQRGGYALSGSASRWSAVRWPARRFMARVISSFVLLAGFAMEARAQMPVTDVASINQSVVNELQTVTRFAQEIEQIKQQLVVAKQTLDSFNGFRGVGQLLENGAGRQSLPANFGSATSSLLVNGYAGGTSAAQAAYSQVKTTPCTRWQGDPNSLGACQAPVMLDASLSVNAREALTNAQTRTDVLKDLTLQADSTTDSKSSADLQGRIAAEQTQLQAEKTMLDAAAQVQEAELRLAVVHQADLGIQIVTQAGRTCYTCP